MQKWGLAAHLFGGGVQSRSDHRVMVYVINSARNNLTIHAKKELSVGHRIFLICDECHRYERPVNRRIFDFVTPDILSGDRYFCLGLSATPFGGTDDAVLKTRLGAELFCYDFSNAVSDGVISGFLLFEIAADFLPDDASLETQLTSRQKMKIPFVSAAIIKISAFFLISPSNTRTYSTTPR